MWEKESVADRMRYAWEKQRNSEDLYPRLTDRAGWLVGSLRYYRAMLREITDVSRVIRSTEDDQEALVQAKRWNELVELGAEETANYYGNLAVLYGRAFLEGKISPSEEAKYIGKGKAMETVVLGLYEASRQRFPALVTSLEDFAARWRREGGDVSDPDGLMILPRTTRGRRDIKGERVLGLCGKWESFFEDFGERMVPVLDSIIGESRDVMVVGNVASGVPDAGIVTSLIRKTFPKKRTSLVLANYSPVKLGDGGVNWWDYEERAMGLAKRLEAVVIVVDHFSHSGGTVKTFINPDNIWGNRAFCWISSADQNIACLNDIEEVFYGDDLGLGIYRRFGRSNNFG